MNHLYHVTTNLPQLSAETEVRTNDIYLALDTYLDESQNGNPVMLVSGLTGEILAISNHEGIEDHATAEFELIIRGYLATLTAEEELVEECDPSSPYPNDSLVLTLDSGEEVVLPLTAEDAAKLLFTEIKNWTVVL